MPETEIAGLPTSTRSNTGLKGLTRMPNGKYHVGLGTHGHFAGESAGLPWIDEKGLSEELALALLSEYYGRGGPLLADLSGGRDPLSGVPPGGTVTRTRQERVGQQRLRLETLARWGTACVKPGCGYDAVDPDGRPLVVAAHLQPWSVAGSMDAENCRPMCATHHLEFDRGMWQLD